jgi:tetratricopeptide (TPR) repeat protein
MRTPKFFPRQVAYVLFPFLISALILSGCCPPNCPGNETWVPTQRPPSRWNDFLDKGKFDEIIEETTTIIDRGPETQYFAEAHLYRGVATLQLAGDPANAHEDLNIAENHIEELITIDVSLEKELLFLNQAIALEKLGEVERANFYLEEAKKLNYTNPNVIDSEFKDASEKP